jgi:hypothetical protein
MRSLVNDFKPIAGRVRLTAKAACDYTNRPEVTATPPVASESEQMLRREELAAVERAEARLAAGTFGLSIERGRQPAGHRVLAVRRPDGPLLPLDQLGVCMAGLDAQDAQDGAVKALGRREVRDGDADVVEHRAEATVVGMLGWIKAESERVWWHAPNG